MKIAIYTPYLDTAGGGEKYILTIAQILSKNNNVDILLDKNFLKKNIRDIKKLNEERFDLDLSNVNWINSPLGKDSNILKRLFFLKKYDLLIYNSDGSWFFSSAKKNIIHFQIPFTYINSNSISKKINLLRWNKAIFNSEFTKDIITNLIQIKGDVLYPPVDTSQIFPLVKHNQIISVGRFSAHTRSKKHEVMINLFKKMVDQKKLINWHLILVGGMMEGDKGYVNKLKESALDYKISIVPNLPVNDLRKMYGESKIYWHAAGYEEVDPEKFEHFGISTVEAMSGGAVPIVINKGGQKEIVENNKSGYLWDNLTEMENMTVRMSKDIKLFKNISSNAILRSKYFSSEIFKNNLEKILYE